MLTTNIGSEKSKGNWISYLRVYLRTCESHGLLVSPVSGNNS
jgi:hypothetical protein